MGLGETPDTHLSITLQALRLQLLGTHLLEVAMLLRQQQGWEMHQLQGLGIQMHQELLGSVKHRLLVRE